MNFKRSITSFLFTEKQTGENILIQFIEPTDYTTTTRDVIVIQLKKGNINTGAPSLVGSDIKGGKVIYTDTTTEPASVYIALSIIKKSKNIDERETRTQCSRHPFTNRLL